MHLSEIDNHDDLVAVLRSNLAELMPVNLLYITVDDHFGYAELGKQPIRRHPHMGMFIKNGTLPESDWVGFVKPEQRLQVWDVERGYLVTANNKPASSKYLGGIYDTNMYTGRADRIEQLLAESIASGTKLTK